MPMDIPFRFARPACMALLLSLVCPAVLQAGEPPASVPARIQAEQVIRHLLMRTFDRPDSRLSVDPVVVRGDHAVAGWTQGDRGGRALLARDTAADRWHVVLCAGDGLRDAAMLQAFGVPAEPARALARAVAAAEETLPAGRRAQLGTFEGVVRLGPDGHPPHPAAPAPKGVAHGHH